MLRQDGASENAQNYIRVGIIHETLGQYAEAQATYQKCAALPGGLIAGYMLQDLEERLGAGADDSIIEDDASQDPTNGAHEPGRRASAGGGRGEGEQLPLGMQSGDKGGGEGDAPEAGDGEDERSVRRQQRRERRQMRGKAGGEGGGGGGEGVEGPDSADG